MALSKIKRTIRHILFYPSRLIAAAVLILWFCLAVDVFTILPKRVFRVLPTISISGDEKLSELWGGFHVASQAIRKEGKLGLTVGMPDYEYTEKHHLQVEYSNPNYFALCYPGRVVPISNREDLMRLRPDHLLLVGSWPEFGFPGDPRNPLTRFVPSLQVIQPQYDSTTA